MNSLSDLSQRHCKACEGGASPLTPQEASALATVLPNWELDTDHQKIRRQFTFANFHETMAFVNALAWVAHQEDHHPDLEVGYARVTVHYQTHAVGGLSENDFICAAKVDALLI